MKRTILFAICCVGILWCLVYAADPNEPILIELPAPNEEVVNKIDDETARVTTSYDIDRQALLEQKTRLLERLEAIDKRLAVFK